MNNFPHLATKSLAGELLSREEAFGVLQTSDEYLIQLLDAALLRTEKVLWAQG